MAEDNWTGNLPVPGPDQAVHAHMRQSEQEDLGFRAWVPGGGLSISSRTTPGSALGTAIATFILAACGCACAVVLVAVRAPAWTAAPSLGLPTVIFFGLRRIGRRRQEDEVTDSPVDALPVNVALPAPRTPPGLPARDIE
jgi:hypothetical protein